MKYPITPDYLAHVPDPLVRLYQDLEDDIIRKICESLAVNNEPNATALELIRQLQRRGMPLKEINERIKKTLKISDRELSNALDNAVQRNNAYYNAAYDALNIVQEQAELDAMAAEVEAIARQTRQVMRNITQSMGFGMRGMDGSIVISDVQRTYQQILDRAEMRVLSSACSYNEAIRDGIREMANSGLVGEWVEYRDEAGEVYHRNRVDVAVRRAVMTGVAQISGQRAEMASEKMETPYREVSAHRGARDVDGPNGWENHKKWQGKVYSVRTGDKYPSIYEVCGLGDVTGLEGANCRHMHFPFVEGFSERTYTDEELEKIDRPPFTYQGRKYSAYEATQKQRQIERSLRQVKRRMNAFKAAGDQEAYTAEAARYQALNEEYTKFSKAADLPLQRERSFIREFGPKEAREAEKALAKIRNSDIITAEGRTLNQERLDAEIPAKYKDDFSDYQSLELTSAERSAMKQLNLLSKQTGKEHGCAIINGESSKPFTSNETGRVQVPEEYSNAEHVKLYHSHTNSTPPSRDDLRWLTRENVDEIGVTALNGDVFIVSRGDGELVSAEVFDQESARISKNVNLELMEYDDFFEWTMPQRNYMAIREQFFQICREFGWTMKGGKI